MDGDGSHRKKVTVSGPDTDFDPSWSPSGAKVVYRVNSDSDRVAPNGIGLDGIHVVDVRSRDVEAVEPRTGGLFPDWSPRGNQILFSGVRRAGDDHDSIWLMKPDGSRMHAIATQQAECGEWSPDATRILYCSQPGDGDFETWVMDSDGTHRKQLTHSDGIDTGAVWSPDGSEIAFASTRDGSSDLYVMSADGSHQRRVFAAPATGESPNAWLPGAGIVFSEFRNGAPLPRWFVVHSDGSHLRSLPQLQGAADPLDWKIFDG